jgi:hypothetical protein
MLQAYSRAMPRIFSRSGFLGGSLSLYLALQLV